MSTLVLLLAIANATCTTDEVLNIRCASICVERGAVGGHYDKRYECLCDWPIPLKPVKLGPKLPGEYYGRFE